MNKKYRLMLESLKLYENDAIKNTYIVFRDGFSSWKVAYVDKNGQQSYNDCRDQQCIDMTTNYLKKTYNAQEAHL